ncbi:MAG: YggS family pyridoxal phosphate-dependent enzyme, partial [Pseudomonadota bacterium]|nr:YggS family pyridoxal phosphate-dependent enzyme [Pseudomonadota bacterium]
MSMIEKNYPQILQSVKDAAKEYHRDIKDILLLAVSKKQPVKSIIKAHALGQNDFAENFVQEGIEKINALKSEKICWHFIGHLQSNKTRKISENFSWVHTVDRLKIAERLSAQRPSYAKDLNVCVQINIDEEDNKSGTKLEKLLELCLAISDLPKLRLRGLMCIPKIHNEHEIQRPPFAKLRNQLESLNKNNLNLDT